MPVIKSYNQILNDMVKKMKGDTTWSDMPDYVQEAVANNTPISLKAGDLINSLTKAAENHGQPTQLYINSNDFPGLKAMGADIETSTPTRVPDINDFPTMGETRDE